METCNEWETCSLYNIGQLNFIHIDNVNGSVSILPNYPDGEIFMESKIRDTYSLGTMFGSSISFLKLSTPCFLSANHSFLFQQNAHIMSNAYIYIQLPPTCCDVC